MASDLTDDFQAAASRMGLPTLEFRTPLAQRIQCGDAEELVSGYMLLIERCETHRYDILSTLGARTYRVSELHCALLDALGHSEVDDGFWSMSGSLAQGEAEHLLHRLDGDALLPTQMVDPTVEFLAWIAHVADLDVELGTVRLMGYKRASSERRNATVRAARLDTARALNPSGAAAERLWCIGVLDAALAAGWTWQRYGPHRLPLDPPAEVEAPWISLRCIDPNDRASVKKLAAKLRRAGVSVPEPPASQAGA
ncbi:hypothetical protein TSST111916_19015 [Tsukamurella strandjordii]|uniref:hypothetical protein n=1 Tax=Tsukamurella TaxID=2060 RepID=UPI001C7D6A30|nr:hypothetical protein [Tsukamurella sp. TY48]GIZ97523.1 hypothetical protein TTY48_21350 [Tsukamurella sp. TY48]